jgi:uncharacterized protein (UPF0548 family)
MEIAGIRPGRRSSAEIESRIAAVAALAPSYRHVGSTLGDAPPGVPELLVERTVPGSVARAREALRSWASHRGIGGRVVPDGPPEEGATVAVVIGVGPVEVLVVDRVVQVVDEPDRFGFAYGTLPGHPETGEELFLATSAGPDHVRLTVKAHARAVGVAAVGSPVTRWIQRRAAHGYVDAWATAL